MKKPVRANLYLGLVCVLFAVLTLTVWIPLDVKSGILEKVRGRMSIGDALAPTVAASFILLGGFLLVLFERKASDQPALTLKPTLFIGRLVLLFAVAILLMRLLGPWMVAFTNLFAAEPQEYRLLRVYFPWKYIGFVSGGLLLVAGVIALVERRLTWRAVLTGVLVVMLMILFYDLPFDDLLLPPNGDV